MQVIKTIAVGMLVMYDNKNPSKYNKTTHWTKILTNAMIIPGIVSAVIDWIVLRVKTIVVQIFVLYYGIGKLHNLIALCDVSRRMYYVPFQS